MLLQLKKSMRRKLGRIVALAYLFCMLAPAAALAWGSGPAPCLGDEILQTEIVPVHHHMTTGQLHDGSFHDHAGPHAHQQSAAQDAPAPHHHGGKGTAGPCCAMMCVNALPADLPGFGKPMQPASVCTPEILASLHSEAPPRHYRPPIA